MRVLQHLFDNNRAWAAAVEAQRPGFFATLARQQAPRYLWIGCADSRVPANDIVGLLPGELFVHRNVANLVVPDDLNCLAVLQYAIDVLRVEHVIVCGHYGCGGVQAAMESLSLGLIDTWLRHLRRVANKHAARLAPLPPDQRADRLCELNVLEQVVRVCESPVVTAAWARGQPVAVHGWIYRLSDGLLRDLGLTVLAADELDAGYRHALASLWSSPRPA